MRTSAIIIMLPGNLLLIANDRNTTETVAKMASEISFTVHEASAVTFAETYYAVNADVIILDIVTEDMANFEILKFLNDHHSKAIILLLSGRQEWYRRLVRHLLEKTALTIHGGLPKPFRERELREQLRDIQIRILSSKKNHVSEDDKRRLSKAY